MCTLKSTAPSQSHKFHPIPKCDVSANALSSQIQRQMQTKIHDLATAAIMQRRTHVPSHHAKKGAHANTKQEKQPQMEISIC